MTKTKNFINKAKSVHGDRYDYSLVEYQHSQTKVKIICSEHGVFEQTPSHHLLAHGCPVCSGSVLNTMEFIKRAIVVHGDKYDYSLVDYIASIKKVSIICKLHGEFKQKPNGHLRGRGCPVCGKTKIGDSSRLTVGEFIERARNVHGDRYDYSFVDYTTAKNKVTIICPEHGEFSQQPNNHLNNDGCPLCSAPHGEKYTHSFLKYYFPEAILEHQFPIENPSGHRIPYTFDFRLPDFKILIEVNGIQHYHPSEYHGGEEEFEERLEHDAYKAQWAEDNGYTLFIIDSTQDLDPQLNQLAALL